MINLLHFLAGFLFVFVDTDQFLVEQNPFTGSAFVQTIIVYRLYNYFFVLYFFALSANILRLKNLIQVRLAMGVVVLCCAYATVRLWADHQLIRVAYDFFDIQNLFLLVLVAALVAHPASWRIWILPFSMGAIPAFIIRVGFALFGEKQHNDTLGVDLGGFFGTFNGHLEFEVTACLLAAVLFAERRKWGWLVIMLLAALLGMAVIGSGFRRMPMVRAVLIPTFGLLIAYWLCGRLALGVFIAGAIVVSTVSVFSIALVVFFGTDALQDRINSLINPSAQTVSTGSNDAYLEDFSALGKVLTLHPLGVGYFHSYNVRRTMDEIMIVSKHSPEEVPLHVGCLDLVARTGIFGAIALLGIIVNLMLTLRWLRGRVSLLSALMAGGGTAFFVTGFLTPIGSPIMGHIKLMATYAISLGLVYRMVWQPALGINPRPGVFRQREHPQLTSRNGDLDVSAPVNGPLIPRENA